MLIYSNFGIISLVKCMCWQLYVTVTSQSILMQLIRCSLRRCSQKKQSDAEYLSSFFSTEAVCPSPLKIVCHLLISVFFKNGPSASSLN